jgi:hypothetical protein
MQTEPKYKSLFFPLSQEPGMKKQNTDFNAYTRTRWHIEGISEKSRGLGDNSQKGVLYRGRSPRVRIPEGC